MLKWDGSYWSQVFEDDDGYDYGAVYRTNMITAMGDVYLERVNVNCYPWMNIFFKWNGTTSKHINLPLSGSWSLATSIAGTDDALYVGGQFDHAGNVAANNIAKWDGFTWSALGLGIGTDVNEGVFALAVKDGDVYAGGKFYSAGGISANNIAKWDSANSKWLNLGSGPKDNVWFNGIALLGNDVYVFERFCAIEKWDGLSWQRTGKISTLDLGVENMLSIDADHALYAVGKFSRVDSTSSFIDVAHDSIFTRYAR